MRSKEALQIRILNLCDENELSLNALGARCGITQSTLTISSTEETTPLPFRPY